MGVSIAERNRRKRLRESILTKEYLYENYVEKRLSANQIAINLRDVDNSLTAAEVIRYLQLHQISTRSVKESCSLPERKRLMEETNLRKFGAVNPLSRGTTAFEKKNQTVLERYGVANVRQAPEVIKKAKETKRNNGTLGRCNPEAISAAYQRRLSDPRWSAQFSKTLSEKAKKRWSKASPELKKQHIEKLRAGREVWWQNLNNEARQAFLMKAGFVSQLEIEFLNLIEEQLGLRVQRQIVIEGYRYAFDGQLEGTKLILEVNSTFFHADPRVYAEADELRFPDGQVRTAKYVWERDFKKNQAALDLGYKVLVFWEKDILEAPEIELGRIWREYADCISQEDFQSKQEV